MIEPKCEGGEGMIAWDADLRSRHEALRYSPLVAGGVGAELIV